MDNLGYLLAGYLLTAGALSVYVAGLMARLRRTRRRIESIEPGPDAPAGT